MTALGFKSIPVILRLTGYRRKGYYYSAEKSECVTCR